MSRVATTLAFIAAKPLLARIREQGIPCRYQAADNTIKVGWRCAGRWYVETVQADSASVHVWLWGR